MEMAEPVDYAVFHKMLSDLVTRGETGTLYLKNDANHLAIIGVRSGRIVSFACGPKRGIRAIELVRKTVRGTYRIDRGAVSFHEQELPSTQEVLELLDPLAPAPQDARGDSGGDFGPIAAASGKTRILCELLTEYIGPIAPMVCEERIGAGKDLSGPDAVQAVIADLSREIDNGEEANEFIQRAQEALDPGGTALIRPAAAVQGDRFSIVEILEIKEGLCDLLTDYIGPAAPLVCEDSIASIHDEVTRPELEKLIGQMAKEIGDADEAREFISAAWDRIAAVSG